MENHYSGVRIKHRTSVGPAIHTVTHIHAAVLDLPAPTLDEMFGHETQMPVCEHRIEIVLIAVELPCDRGDIVLTKILPDPTISNSIPQHYAGIDAAPAGPPEMPEISYGPEVFSGQAQHPIYGPRYHGVKIKVQNAALDVLTIKHLHLVPPAFFAACYAWPVLQDVLDHGGWHWPIVFSKHMETHRASEIGLDHMIEPFYIVPGIEIAVYHTGAVYGGHVYLPLLFFHWDIYRVIYVDKYPYENYRPSNRRI